MEAVLDVLLGLGGTLAYVIIGLLAFGEAAAFVGLLLPGEMAVLVGGVLASQGRIALTPLLITVAVAAVAGDSAGYEIGRRWGPRLLATRMARRHAQTIADAQRYLQQRGGLMVFLGRWTSVLRAVVPALAGMGRMPYPRFFLFNMIGGIAWAVAFGLGGYAAGESYHYIEQATGLGSWVLTALLVGGVTCWVVWRRRARRLLLRRGGPDDGDGPRGGVAAAGALDGGSAVGLDRGRDEAPDAASDAAHTAVPA